MPLEKKHHMGLICQLYCRTRTMEMKVHYNYPFKSLVVTLHITTFNIQKFYLAVTSSLINAHNVLQKPTVSSQIRYL